MVLVSQQNPNERKEVRKVQPGKAVTLEDFRDEENDQALESTPCSSTRKSSKNTHKKKVKKEDASRLIFHQNRNQIKKYGFVWFVKKSGRQMIIGGFYVTSVMSPFISSIVGLSMKKKIIDIDIESLFFECENCTDDL